MVIQRKISSLSSTIIKRIFHFLIRPKNRNSVLTERLNYSHIQMIRQGEDNKNFEVTTTFTTVRKFSQLQRVSYQGRDKLRWRANYRHCKIASTDLPKISFSSCINLAAETKNTSHLPREKERGKQKHYHLSSFTTQSGIIPL